LRLMSAVALGWGWQPRSTGQSLGADFLA
jgi:hypothetical protein